MDFIFVYISKCRNVYWFWCCTCPSCPSLSEWPTVRQSALIYMKRRRARSCGTSHQCSQVIWVSSSRFTLLFTSDDLTTLMIGITWPISASFHIYQGTLAVCRPFTQRREQRARTTSESLDISTFADINKYKIHYGFLWLRVTFVKSF